MFIIFMKISKTIIRIFSEEFDYQFLSYYHYHYYPIFHYYLNLTFQYFYMSYYVQLQTKTWDRRENLNLFDHQEENIKMQNLKIYKTGLIIRDNKDFRISFIQQKQKIQQEAQILFGLEKKQNSFDIIKNGGKQQSIYTLVPTIKSNGIQKFIIIEGDNLKIGKIEITILKLKGQKKNSNSHYKKNTSQIQNYFNQQNNQSIRSSEFNHSELETLPICRFCLSHAQQSNNPIINCCSCSGSAKFIHIECLAKWITPRIKKNNLKSKIIFSITKKGAICELCRDYFNFHLILSTIFNNDIRAYAIIEVSDQENQLFIMNFTDKSDIIIGRGANSDLNLNDITASRMHCKIMYENQKGIFYIRDLQSKFGTLVQLRNENIKDTIQVQKGRTIIKLTKKHKKNIFSSMIQVCGFSNDLTEDQKDN